jgi:hypothetical protein
MVSKKHPFTCFGDLILSQSCFSDLPARSAWDLSDALIKSAHTDDAQLFVTKSSGRLRRMNTKDTLN